MFGPSMAETVKKRHKMLLVDRMLPLLMFFVFTVVELFVVLTVVSFAVGSSSGDVLWRALGDLGRWGVLEDASWLFPTFIAVLFALVVVPARFLDEEDVEQAYKQKIVRLMPAVVGIAALGSLVLVVLGVIQYPSAASRLYSPVLVSVVTVGVAYALTASLVRRPRYRIASLRGQIEEVDAAEIKTEASHGPLSPRFRSWRELAKRSALSLVVSTVVPSAILLVGLVPRGLPDGLLSLWPLLVAFLALAILALSLGAVISAQLWSSRRRLLDRILVGYMYFVPAALAAVVIGAGATSTEPLVAPLMAVPMAIPTVLVWLPERRLPKGLRMFGVHSALGGVVLNFLQRRRDRLQRDLDEQLKSYRPEIPSPEEEDAAWIEVLSRPSRF